MKIYLSLLIQFLLHKDIFTSRMWLLHQNSTMTVDVKQKLKLAGRQWDKRNKNRKKFCLLIRIMLISINKIATQGHIDN